MILFILFSLTKEILLTTYTIDLQTPLIIERSFKAGDSIKITYKYRFSYLITIGKPKFYINLQLQSSRKFHSTTPGLYAIGQSGTVEYTALEAGVHKLFVWTFTDKCKYILALGKHEYNQDRTISPSHWAFIETDPDNELKIKSEGLSSYTWVHWYSGISPNDVNPTVIDSEWGPFDRSVSRLVIVQSVNAGTVKVTISSDGSNEYDFGEYDQNKLDASTVPFFYTSQDQKQNMLDDFYVPVTPITPTSNPTTNPTSNPTSNPSTNPTTNPSSNPTTSTSSQSSSQFDSYTNPPNQGGNKPLDPTENPGNDDGNSDGDSKGGLSGGEWAGVGTAAAAGCGGIATAIAFIVKKVLKKHENSSQEDGGDQIELNADVDVKTDTKTSINTGDGSTNHITNKTINCCNIY